MTEEIIDAEKHGFEWWYFDVEDEKNSVSLTLIFKRKNTLIHARNPLIYIEYKHHKAAETWIKDFPISDYSFSHSNGIAEVKIGNNVLRIRKDSNGRVDSYDMSIVLGKIKANLHFTPLHIGFKPTKEGKYFFKKGHPEIYTAVNFAAPRMTCSGTFTLPDKEFQIMGEGYHDHPWGTATLMETNHEWHWSRLYNDKYTIMLADVTPQADFDGQQKYIYFARVGNKTPTIVEHFVIEASDWRISTKHFNFPHALHISCSELSLDVKTTYKEGFMDLPVYNRSQVNVHVEKTDENVTAEGIGWTEYCKVPRTQRGIMQFVNKRDMKGKMDRTAKFLSNH